MPFRITASTLAMWVACPIALSAGQPNPAPGAALARAEILILGVYHMANPGRDIFNIEADDVLAPRRQAEIAEVIEVLKRFNPTKVAVEGNVSDQRHTQNYRAYLAGGHELSRNEIEQLGFRLAGTLGHRTIHPVDASGEFPYPNLVNYAKANNQAEALDSLMAETGRMVQAQNTYLATHTILETLRYMNDDARVAAAMGAYFRMAQFGEPWAWAGADLVADWYRRNMRIYTNIVRLIETPDERILVIYGAGHLGWLQQAVAGSPNLRLRTLEGLFQ